MSGIYIHIPFCKQACHYCDFHFSTSLKKKTELVNALGKELAMRKEEFENKEVETIYFGGGTPSLLSTEELQFIIASVYNNYNVSQNPEITLEANPDDLSDTKIIQLANTPINRLSIGIQSFFDSDLRLMNRAHSSEEAKKCLGIATNYFGNISLDLIYGIPNASHDQWIENIETALSFKPQHISSYALTVEPQTALKRFIDKGLIADVDDDKAESQFFILKDRLENEGFVHYELSNFGREGYFSKNNSAYWQGKPYLGIGPSAHSFNGSQRGWNVRNNSKYINEIAKGQLPIELESLTVTDRYNEYIMTGLRTIWGVSLDRIASDFGTNYKNYLLEQCRSLIEEHLLYLEDDILRVTKKGQFLSDGIASQLFKINLTE